MQFAFAFRFSLMLKMGYYQGSLGGWYFWFPQNLNAADSTLRSIASAGIF